MKLSVWPDSSAGPLLRLLAQAFTVCAPASSSTVWSPPLVKDGTSFTAVTLWLSPTLATLYALVPPAALTSSVAPVLTVTEESISLTVRIGAAPFQLLAGTNLI